MRLTAYEVIQMQSLMSPSTLFKSGKSIRVTVKLMNIIYYIKVLHKNYFNPLQQSSKRKKTSRFNQHKPIKKLRKKDNTSHIKDKAGNPKDKPTL